MLQPIFLAGRSVLPCPDAMAEPLVDLCLDDDHGGDTGMTMQDATASAGEALDPVCGMTVDIEGARSRDLVAEHDGTTYFFCGRGCKLDFEENPGPFLDPNYVPSM